MRRFSRLLAAALLMVCVPALRAEAQQGPTFTVDPTAVELGKEVTVDGFGFEAGVVRIYVDDTSGKPLAEVEHTGEFNFSVEVSGVTEGQHVVIACNNQGRTGICREELPTKLTVLAPSTTTTSPPRITTTTSPARTTTTTSRPTTTVPSVSTTERTTTTLPPEITIATTIVGGLVVGTTTSSTTLPDGIVASIPIGPDPTFDPNPDDIAIVTTTEGPSYASGIDVGEYPDLSVVALEVSQGIQNLTSRMPLVADRTTWVRVHVNSSGEQSWAPVDGALLLQRADQADLVLVPENGPIATKQPRTNINSTLNFEIPDEYLVAGGLSLTALVWSFGPESLQAVEPNPANNMMHTSVEFHTADVPTIWLAALDDGTGPGPEVDNLFGLLGFAQIVMQDMLDYHPTATVDFQVYPTVIDPGSEALVPGEWKLGWAAGEDPDDPDNDATDQPRRTEPNVRLAWLTSDLPEDANVLGMFDLSIPADGYTGWAKHGVSWAKPDAGTPAHEIGHNRGLKHVGCKDADDDGIPDELKGGAVDPYHPTGLPPNCSLAPISTNGYYGLTTERSSLTVYSNDPTDPAAAFPFMGYKNPGWTDPYHWCILLDYVSVPCAPVTTGVYPKVLQPAADCDPEPVGNGIGLELCLIDQLPPPADPFGGSSGAAAPDEAVPWGGPVPYAWQPLCEGTMGLYMTISDVDGESESLPTATCPPAASGEGTVDRFATVDIGEIPMAVDTIVAPEDPTAWILISGWVNLDTGDVALQQAALRDSIPAALHGRYLDNLEGALSGASPMVYAASFRTETGVVSQVPLDLDGAGHGDGGERGAIVSFFQAVPAADHCSKCWIDIWSSGPVLHEPMSPEPPVVSSVAVTDAGDSTVIEWAASDPDGDPLMFDVLWSADGASWLHAATGIGDTTISVPHSARFPGGQGVVVKVVAHDGTRTGGSTSAPFEAPGHEPLMVVSGVPESGVVEQYDTVLLQAHVVDPEDAGTLGDTVAWRSDIDGDLGHGALLRTRDLEPGRHTITVDAADGDGNPVSQTFQLDVAPRTSPTRYLEEPNPIAVALLTGAPLPLTSDEAADDGGVGAAAVAGSADPSRAADESGGSSAALGIVLLAGAAGAVVGGVTLSRRRRGPAAGGA